MTEQQLIDKTGAVVEVDLDEKHHAYVLTFANGEVAGRTYFASASGSEDEWIFYHTVVDDEYTGRGLGGILVGQAMADVARRGKTVVGLCPFVKRWLEKNEEEYTASGGSFREPTNADIATVRSTGA